MLKFIVVQFLSWKFWALQKKFANIMVSKYSKCSDRRSLDRRRLEAAHLRFAILTVQESFPEIFSDNMRILPDVQSMLAEINHKFYLAFRKRYAGVFCYNNILLL